ncbi:hypothetical protein ACQZV8_16115 [Magnetococcales bacterium HHB-1]
MAPKNGSKDQTPSSTQQHFQQLEKEISQLLSHFSRRLESRPEEETRTVDDEETAKKENSAENLTTPPSPQNLAASLTKESALLYQMQAIQATRQKSFENAERAACIAIAADPKNPEMVFTLAWILHEANRLPEAEAEYRRTLALTQEHPKAWFNLGNVLENTKEENSALEAWRKAANLGHEHAQQKVSFIENRREEERRLKLEERKRLIEANRGKAASLKNPLLPEQDFDNKSRSGSLKLLMILLFVIAIAAGGYLFFKNHPATANLYQDLYNRVLKMTGSDPASETSEKESTLKKSVTKNTPSMGKAPKTSEAVASEEKATPSDTDQTDSNKIDSEQTESDKTDSEQTGSDKNHSEQNKETTEPIQTPPSPQAHSQTSLEEKKASLAHNTSNLEEKQTLNQQEPPTNSVSSSPPEEESLKTSETTSEVTPQETVAETKIEERTEENAPTAEMEAPLPQENPLEKKTFPLMVNLSPEKTQITIEGLDQPFEQGMLLPPGEYNLRFSHPGYQSINRQISLPQAETDTVILIPEKTKRQPGEFTLTIQPNPEGATIQILNIVPPYKPGIALKAGYYQILAAHPGYETRRFKVRIRNKDMRVPIHLRRTESHPLTIKTEPKDAQIKLLNYPPAYYPGIRLKPGPYQIEISHPGFQTSRRWFTMPRKARTLPINLAPK